RCVVAPCAYRQGSSLYCPGTEKLSLDAQGGLALALQKGEVRLEKPRIYQVVDGARIEISGNYILKSPHEAGFQIAPYDRSRTLIIDPVLAYSTYLGGSGGNNGGDSANAIAVDSNGNAYVTGFAGSIDFPTTPGAFQTTG